jgi:hypothetical protein
VYGLSIDDAIVNRRGSHQHEQIVDAVDAVDAMQVPDGVVEIDDDDVGESSGTPAYLTNYGRLPMDLLRPASPPPSDALPELPQRPRLAHTVSMAVIGVDLPPLPSVPSASPRGLVLPELPIEARLVLPEVPVLELSDDDRDQPNAQSDDNELPDAAAMFPQDDSDDDDDPVVVVTTAPSTEALLDDVPDGYAYAAIGDSGRASLSASSSSSLELIDFGAAFDDGDAQQQ